MWYLAVFTVGVAAVSFAFAAVFLAVAAVMTGRSVMIKALGFQISLGPSQPSRSDEEPAQQLESRKRSGWRKR
jgi:hypothetical protein